MRSHMTLCTQHGVEHPRGGRGRHSGCCAARSMEAQCKLDPARCGPACILMRACALTAGEGSWLRSPLCGTMVPTSTLPLAGTSTARLSSARPCDDM